jgi:hypothetical protein
MTIAITMRRAACALLMPGLLSVAVIARPVHAAEDNDGNGFAHRICDIYTAPVEHATFLGGGAGCTWIIGNGEKGITSTEITMTADRNADPSILASLPQDFEILAEGMMQVPGYSIKDSDVVCGGGSVTGRVIYWGEPYSGNIYGYAICDKAILIGEIHYPPNESDDAKSLYLKLMSAMVPLLSLR